MTKILLDKSIYIYVSMRHYNNIFIIHCTNYEHIIDS